MKNLRSIIPIFIVLLFLVNSNCANAQKFYYFENIKTGKSYRMSNKLLSFKLEIYNPDTNVTRIFKYVNCLIDSATENTLYIKKAYERTEIYFANSKIQKTESRYLEKGGSIKFNGIDSINVKDVIEVLDYSRDFDRYNFINYAVGTIIIGLGLVTIIGPFVFNEYFKVVGISFVSSIPIFITSAILQNKYILKGKKPNDKIKWKLVYR
jgi:hypothetical protein